MRFIIRNLANIFTLSNMFCGTVGIIHVLNGNIVTGSILLFVAGVFDLLDGMIARLTKTTSTLGKDLDSLADMVSFGVLPALIVHRLLLSSHQEWVYYITFLQIPIVSLIPFIITGGAAVRLARFNNDPTQHKTFKGLPTPANGIFFASLPIILRFDLYHIGYHTIYLRNYILNPFFLVLLCIIFMWLMVCKIPVMSMKFSSFKWKDNYPVYILFILFVILFSFLYYLSIPLIILFYILLSIIFKRKISEV